jgi:sugar phosphate isomerase/epimerase
MRIGLVSYTYHRFFGEPYEPVQQDPGVRWTMHDVVQKTADFGLDGILLETKMMPSTDEQFLRKLRTQLDDLGLDRDVSWGTPNGLNTGKDPAAIDDLIRHIDLMKILGVDRLRIVGGSKRTAHEPHGPALERLGDIIANRCIPVAEKAGVTLAFENHWDYSAAEVLELVETVDSPFFKVTYDTGNALRVGDDPVEAARLLAPYIVATNVKDIGTPWPSADDWRAEFPCVPFGRGLIDIAEIVRILDGNGLDPMVAIEMDRPREDFLDEDDYVRECAGFLRGVRDTLRTTTASVDPR